jgi:hypothetical protein
MQWLHAARVFVAALTTRLAGVRARLELAPTRFAPRGRPAAIADRMMAMVDAGFHAILRQHVIHFAWIGAMVGRVCLAGLESESTKKDEGSE